MAFYSFVDDMSHDVQVLIVTGGYRQDDNTFPVWAFFIESDFAAGNSATNPWVLLSSGESYDGGPTPRMDHVSTVVNDFLYVWGGASLEEREVDRIPYIWRADLRPLQWHRHDPQDIDGSKMTAPPFKWTCLVPNIRTQRGIQNQVDRGERCKEVGNKPLVNRREEELVRLFWHEVLTSINATSTFNSTRKAPPKVISRQDVLHLSRQGARGGVWTGYGPESFFVMFGGSSNNRYPWGPNPTKHVQLNDVWMLHPVSCTFQQVLGVQQGNFPSKREKHAATVTANGDLVVNGGYTSKNDHDHSFVPLGDHWVLHLKDLGQGGAQWEERDVPQYPKRWDHTIVVASKARLVVFGGCVSSSTNVIRPDPDRYATADTILIDEKTHTVSLVVASSRKVPHRQFGHAATTDRGGRMYIWGEGSDYVWRFDPSFVEPHSGGDSNSWSNAGGGERCIWALFVCTFASLAGCTWGWVRRQLTRTSSRRTEAPSRSRDSTNDIGLSLSYTAPYFMSLPIVGREEDACSICLMEYALGDRLRTLPCHHEFHAECIGRWLEENNSCPTCRRSLGPGVENTTTTTNSNFHPNNADEAGNEESAQLIAS